MERKINWPRQISPQVEAYQGGGGIRVGEVKFNEGKINCNMFSRKQISNASRMANVVRHSHECLVSVVRVSCDNAKLCRNSRNCHTNVHSMRLHCESCVYLDNPCRKTVENLSPVVAFQWDRGFKYQSHQANGRQTG